MRSTYLSLKCNFAGAEKKSERERQSVVDEEAPRGNLKLMYFLAKLLFPKKRKRVFDDTLYFH